LSLNGWASGAIAVIKLNILVKAQVNISQHISQYIFELILEKQPQTPTRFATWVITDNSVYLA
jgi:hypothetical protein